MIDHVSIQAADVRAAAAFYDAVLAPLGGKRILDYGEVIGYGVEFPDFWIGPVTTGWHGPRGPPGLQGARPGRGAGLLRRRRRAGRRGAARAQVWPEYHETYFGGFVRDPDGNNVEAVCHTPE